MKIAKRATQKNFEVNEYFYTEKQLSALYINEEITKIEGVPGYRVYADWCKEVKVVLTDGFYTTVVVTNEGTEIYVSII